MYSLAPACFTKAEFRRLDGFQSKCLRKVLKIQPSYYSRVSNAEVRRIAEVCSSSDALRSRQLLLLGRVLVSTDENALQQLSFTPGMWQPATSRYIRRVGRPRKEWVPEVLSLARCLVTGDAQLADAVRDKAEWKRIVHSRL